MEEADFAHFNAISWCSALLADTSYRITPTFSRQPKASTEDSLFAVALRSPSTISHCITLFTPPASPGDFITSVITLFTLGRDMNGGVNMLHGGIIATLIDDTIGTLLTVNKEGKLGTGAPITQSTVTATQNVKFLKGVRTPATIAVQAWCRKREGRKFWCEAEMRDSEGVVMAKGEALWIRVGRSEEKKEKL
jgi:acyl-coenzyme A thioesterase PaaI-like protein